MFKEDEPTENPLTLCEKLFQDDEKYSYGPQDIWLQFLIRRFEVVNYYSSEQVNPL